MNPVMHALGLHLYQPLDNLHKLLKENPEELRRILLCYERIGRYAHKYVGIAHMHVALSGVLLEQLRDPKLINACRELVDIPSVLESLRSAPNIEFVGTGFRHAPLPFIPQEDWEDQLLLERELMSSVFGRVLKGYFPPSTFFCADMVPALVSAGYEYLLLPTYMLTLPEGGEADPYRPYKLTHHKVSITVVPVDAGFSQSQQYGLEAPWFADEVRNGVMLALPYSAPYLLTTWSDGENGEWFRTYEEQGFFGSFFSPYMEFSELGAFPIQPVSITEYLKNHPAQTQALLKPEYTSSPAFPGDLSLKRKLSKLVAQYWSMAKSVSGNQAATNKAILTEARALLLQAEESGLLLGEGSGAATLKGLLSHIEKLLMPKAPVYNSELQHGDIKESVAKAKVSRPSGLKLSMNPNDRAASPAEQTVSPSAKTGAKKPAGEPTPTKGRPQKK
jgi:hypothetical protein